MMAMQANMQAQLDAVRADRQTLHDENAALKRSAAPPDPGELLRENKMLKFAMTTISERSTGGGLAPPGGDSSKPLDFGAAEFDTYKLAREPPSADVQAALHKAADAAPVPVSEAEKRLLEHPPAADAPEEMKMLHQFQLLRARDMNPAAAPLPYKGATVLSSAQLPPNCPQPVGLASWTEFIGPRNMVMNEDATELERERSRLGSKPAVVHI
jgi:hypothetical protein